MKTLILDIETTPHLAHVWGLWQQNVGLNQLVKPTEVLCWGAKWHGKKEFLFGGGATKREKKAGIVQVHRLLDEADAVVTYNGDRFDLPHLNREFLEAGMAPPSPYARIDLLKIARTKFRFASNKLAHVAHTLGIGDKGDTGGHELWIKCMAGDPKAWVTMKKYNLQDVRLTEQLYDKLVPWATNHPNVALIDGKPEACPNCGNDNLHARGYAFTKLTQYKRYRCNDCGTWSRGKEKLGSVAIRTVV